MTLCFDNMKPCLPRLLFGNLSRLFALSTISSTVLSSRSCLRSSIVISLTNPRFKPFLSELYTYHIQLQLTLVYHSTPYVPSKPMLDVLQVQYLYRQVLLPIFLYVPFYLYLIKCTDLYHYES